MRGANPPGGRGALRLLLGPGLSLTPQSADLKASRGGLRDMAGSPPLRKQTVTTLRGKGEKESRAGAVITVPFPESWTKESSASGFPGGAVVEGLPAGAGHAGSSPGLGGSHMPLSGWARGPRLLSLRVWSLCSAAGEAAVVRGPRTAMRSGPRLPRLERALAQRRRPSAAINKWIDK